MPHPIKMPTFQELTNLSEQELIRGADQQSSLTPNERHLMLAQLYRDELVRRHQDMTTNQMLSFTGQVRNLTVVILLLTLLNVIVACNAFWIAFKMVPSSKAAPASTAEPPP